MMLFLLQGSSPDISDDPFRQLVLIADDPKAKEKELSNLAAAAAAYVEITVNLNFHFLFLKNNYFIIQL